ncbi:MAG: hypothetical protein FJZ90_03445 [Chloroflexi bacterium]|nr:hypothetical protein [Chloroflexota bacterium]
MDVWKPLIWLAAGLALMVPVTRWFSHRLQSLVSLVTLDSAVPLYVLAVVFLPGTLVHELSHWLAAKLLGVKTGGLSLLPQPLRGNVVRIGSVRVQQTDVVRESLIGLAPLVSGTALVLLIAQWQFGLSAGLTWGWADLPPRISHILRAPDAWLWLYMIIAISNAMVPSSSDRRSWRTLAIYLLLVAIVFLAVGALPRLSDAALSWSLRMASHLAFALSLSIALDLLVGGFLLLCEALLSLLLGRYIEYD